MAAPQVDHTILAFKRRMERSTTLARNTSSSEPLTKRRIQHAGSSLTLVLDRFLETSGPEAYLFLNRVSISFEDYEFETGMDLKCLDALEKLFVVRDFISQSTDVNISNSCAANIVIKLMIDFYPDLVNTSSMSRSDKSIISKIKKLESLSNTDIPTFKIDDVPERKISDEEIEHQVPESIRKIYENSVAWKTATAKETNKKGLLRGGALKAFSLM